MVATELLWRTGPAQRELALELKRLIVDADVAPGACVAAAVRHEGVFHAISSACGTTAWDQPTPTSARHVYDLASVTKPLFAWTLARLQDREQLDLRQPLREYLDWTEETPSGAIPLELLLSHRAGLEAHLELFAVLRDNPSSNFDRDSAMRRVANARRQACQGSPPAQGFPPVYSDLGYILLGEVVRHIAHCEGRSLGQLVASELRSCGLGELASAAQWIELRGQDAWRDAAVPTETVAWRGGQVRGLVHDDNAFALSGSDMCGHAGMFGTAPGVLAFACAMLDERHRRTRRLSDEALDLLLRTRPGGSLRAGFDSKAPEGSSVGNKLGPQTFGHLGFTGTSVWCDPEAEIAVVLLSNRVCPSRDNPRMVGARPRVHELLTETVAQFCV